MKNKLKLTTTSKASTKMLYYLIQTNAVLNQIIKDQQKKIILFPKRGSGNPNKFYNIVFSSKCLVLSISTNCCKKFDFFF